MFHSAVRSLFLLSKVAGMGVCVCLFSILILVNVVAFVDRVKMCKHEFGGWWGSRRRNNSCSHSLVPFLTSHTTRWLVLCACLLFYIYVCSDTMRIVCQWQIRLNLNSHQCGTHEMASTQGILKATSNDNRHFGRVCVWAYAAPISLPSFLSFIFIPFYYCRSFSMCVCVDVFVQQGAYKRIHTRPRTRTRAHA